MKQPNSSVVNLRVKFIQTQREGIIHAGVGEKREDARWWGAHREHKYNEIQFTELI